ncbi:protein stoned-B [Nasonia vitripennis]|uniref:Protein stoned-B n=1 Tax=Nasonia vitripennis TaxID=7425 RepID=A0A7M7TDC4_NASVI|nr:protein stoned-B [Nasonia vitripennis]XP_032455237.1 protein stoned-B [Nasonia vitripennis]
MDSKGGNPFLMDDYPAPDASMAQASNPFLQDFSAPAEEATAGADVNPFFNFVTDQTYQPPTDSTNPFASFGMEAAAVVPEPEPTSFVSPEAAAVPQAPEPVTTVDLFGDEPVQPAAATPVQLSSPPQATPVTSPPSKPSRPPPPPRPGPPPPPRNTKDLILSVTGAMDETSNQMLDRLQATRTPSPTLMHSPSPTPEHSFADLLDVDGSVPDLIHDAAKVADDQPDAAGNNTQDMLGLFDAPPAQAPAQVQEAGVGVTPTATDATLFSPPAATSTLSDNPFSDVGAQDAGQMFEPSLVQEKRPSLTTRSPPAAQPAAEITTSRAAEFATPVPEPQPEAHTPAGIFGAVTPSVDASSFYSMPQTTMTSTTAIAAAPTGGVGSAFADLLGDFGGGAQTAQDTTDYMSASPASTTEFPSAGYRADDSFAATTKAIEETGDAFDAFASKFDKAAEPEANTGDPFFDPFTGGAAPAHTAMDTSSDVWGDSSGAVSTEPVTGFGEEADGFDSFLSMTAPPPEVTARRRDSADSDEGPDFSVFIKPKDGDATGVMEGGPVPVLAPPPKSPMNTAYADTSPRFNPFDKSGGFAQEAVLPTEAALPSEMTRTDSQETPPTPLFDEDVSQPLEDFPRVTYTGDGWEMQLRQPIKKKITGQRFWKKIFAKLVYQGDNPVLQLYNSKGDKDPFQELPLLACYSVSDIAAQQFDQYGKIFTVKLQYILYKERPGVRPGQVTKAERITNKLSQFAAYAIQGDYQGVKEFGSDLKKLGLPVEHAPQISQLFKLGSQNYEDMKTFSVAIEEALFRLQVHRDRALQYKMEEVQINVVDELYVEQAADGHVDKQIARVRLFFLGFLSGMPDVELGINDIWRQGKEVVGRHDIIPVATEEWIRLENVEFHACVQQDEYEKSRIIKFKPPDACYIELMRFRVRPPRNRELPLQLKAVMCVTGNKVELRADILVPGFASRKLGRVPCEDVMVRFPIPECWIYLFRVEKHFRYGSVKSAHRRTGKIKGIERFLGAVDTLEPQLMEVTSGQAKYEHQHHAIVWRMPRLPKEGQGAYTTHQLVCRMNLTSYDQIPEKLSEYAYVEFTMPATQVSHTTARSVSFQNFDSDAPPEKYVRNLSRHEYRVGIEHTQGEGPGAYITATSTSLSTPKKTIPESSGESHDESTDHAASDSDSSD